MATNLVLAGVTVWVLFSSVLLNQTLQNNRSEIDARTAAFVRPLKRLSSVKMRTAGWAQRWLAAAAILGLTGIIYGFLDPHFGFNRSSALLFLSAILGVGLVTYVTSGLEAARTRRVHSVHAAVKPYPASIALAVISVAVSRLFDLQPGVMYGFVASCAVTGAGTLDPRRQGAVTIYPVLAGLGLSLFALLAIEPLRGNADIASSFAGQLLIGAGLVVFIGGIEGVAVNMLPLAITDGGKLYNWHRGVWAGIAVVSAFLAWHVLLNRNRQSFDALRPASSWTLVAFFVGYTALSLGVWAYFRWHRAPAPLAEGELPPV